MSKALTDELAVGYGLVAMTQQIGANGGWIQHGSDLIDSNLPFGGGRMDQLTELIENAVLQYRKLDRDVETLFFGFENQFLVVITMGDLHLGLLFPEAADESADYIKTAWKFLAVNECKIRESSALLAS